MKKGKAKAKKENCSNLMMTLMIICVVLSLATLVLVSYDKLVKNDKPAPVAEIGD